MTNIPTMFWFILGLLIVSNLADETPMPLTTVKQIQDSTLSSQSSYLESDLTAKAAEATSPVVMTLPKCCSNDEILSTTEDGCHQRIDAIAFEPNFKIFEHNETHFKNQSLDLSLFVFKSFTSAPNCSTGKYPLQEQHEEYAILKNTSLMIKSKQLSGLLSTKEFCLENIDDNGSIQMAILVCAPEERVFPRVIFIIFVTFTVLSTILFAVTFFLYLFWLKVADIHKKFFMGYSFTMFATFLCLSIVLTVKIEDDDCHVLGFFFQFFMIASFTLLAILCYDIYSIVNLQKKANSKLVLWYLGIAITIPVISIIISLARNLTPDIPDSFFKPLYLTNHCRFEAQEQRLAYFYVPICINILVCIGYLIGSKLEIIKNDRDHQFDYVWSARGSQYKFMLRKHFIIVTTAFLWCLEALLRTFSTTSSILIALDIVEASQGIVIFSLFIIDKETRKLMLKELKRRRRRQVPNVNENLILQ